MSFNIWPTGLRMAAFPKSSAMSHSTANWAVYMIRTRGNRLYTGITVDVARRWEEHCSGKAGAKFFRSDPPAALCLVERGFDRSSASKREALIKRLSAAEKWQLVRCQGPAALLPGSED